MDTRKNILDNLENETTLLVKKIKTLNITQKAQAGKTVEELFVDWDHCPTLTVDMERVEGINVDNSKAWVSAPSHLHTKGVPRQPPIHQGKHTKKYHHPNIKARGEVSHKFSDSDINNSEDCYSTRQS